MEGRVAKIVNERALLEQDFIKDPKKKVSEVIKESVAVIGENIQVRSSSICCTSFLIELLSTQSGMCRNQSLALPPGWQGFLHGFARMMWPIQVQPQLQ